MQKNIFKLMVLVLFIFSSLLQNFINIFNLSDTNNDIDMALAQVVIPNDLSIVKTYSGTVYPGATIEAIIDYQNTGSVDLTGIKITDIYSQWLTFDNIVSSSPDITTGPILFNHDLALRNLSRDEISMSGNSSGQIILQYTVSPSLPPNIDVTNEGIISIGCVLCQDPYTVNSSGISVGFTNPQPRVPPLPYDIGISGDIQLGNTYTSGQYFYIDLDLTNDTYTGQDIMLSMRYKTYLMNFVDIVSSGGIVFPAPIVITPASNNYGMPRSFNSDDETTIMRNAGFGLNSGTTHITLRFSMINDYTVPTPIDFNIGIPDEYGIMSTIGETNTTNNNFSTTVQVPTFDLWTNVTILTGDEISSGVYDSSGTITFRINFGNSGDARDNIFIYFLYNGGTGAISYTGNRNYGPLYDTNTGSMYVPELYSRSVYWKDISLGAGENGYIDITFDVGCGIMQNYNSYISILDNYDTVLGTQDNMADYYLQYRSTEQDVTNNFSIGYMDSNSVCPVILPSYMDYVMNPIYKSISGNFVPGQVVTFWVPFNLFGDYNQSSLQFHYDTGLTFIGLASTGIDDIDSSIEDNMSDMYIDIYNNMIASNHVRSNTDIKFIYDNPAYFVTGECKFPTFPSGTPLDNPIPIWPFINSNSGVISSIYTPNYAYYKSIGYSELYAHIFAFIDVQTYIYEQSNLPQVDTLLSGFASWYYPCAYNQRYVNGINNGESVGQASSNASVYADNATDGLTDKLNLFTLCNSQASLFTDNSLCYKNKNLLNLFYDDNEHLNNSFNDIVRQAMNSAYGVGLTSSGLHQLLTQNIMPFIYQLGPIVRQYSLYTSQTYPNSAVFCPDINCINNYSPYEQNIDVDLYYTDYLQIINSYDPNLYSGMWVPWSGGYIDIYSIFNFKHDIFIDDFSQSGKLQVTYIDTATENLITIGLKFVINEVSSGTVLGVTGDIGSVSLCDPSSDSYDYNASCLTDGTWYYNDTFDITGGNSGDIVIGDDNATGTSITISDREPYNLSITKIMDIYTGINIDDIIEVTTTVCNTGASRNDITITEEYPMGMVYFQSIVSGTDIGASHIMDPIGSQLIRTGVSLNSGECKQIITRYKVTNAIISGSVIPFSSNAGGQNVGLSTNNSVHAVVSGSVEVLKPNIYLPYGDKQIVSSTFFAGDEIIYRINYSNPGSITGIMNLYDIYESGLIFSGLVSSTQGLPLGTHDPVGRTITWSNIVVPPFSNYSIDLSFIIAPTKLPFETITNDFSYSMLFVPENYITDIDQSNNQSSRNGSYYLNIFEGTVLEDTNHDVLYDGGDLPLSGVVVSISQSGILIGTTVTSSSGSYIFDGLLPGNYTVSYTPLSGYNTVVSFTGTINNSGSLYLNGTSILPEYPFYSTISIGNITLMDRYNGVVCGNNIIETGEMCDDGSNNGLAGYCNTNCTDMTAISLCGNGVVNTGEQCDDSNNNNGDACSAICQLEIPSCTLLLSSYISQNPLEVNFAIAGYGFGIAQILQSIDYGDGNVGTSITGTSFTHQYSNIGPYMITATVVNPIDTGVSATCNLIVQSSTTNYGGGGGGTDPDYYCGDGVVNGSEQCDDGNNNNNDSCKNSCTINYNCDITDDCRHGVPNLPPVSPPEGVNTGFDIIKIIPRTGAY